MQLFAAYFNLNLGVIHKLCLQFGRGGVIISLKICNTNKKNLEEIQNVTAIGVKTKLKRIETRNNRIETRIEKENSK